MATLEVMTRGPGLRVDPDIGYWAERWDSDGSLHPLYYTRRIGDRWVNVTTLPMLLAAAPLYEIGGYRAALVVPMLGSVAAAFAAGALARRIRPADDGWALFWLVGLASPMTVYALDFWEHSWGAALIAWAIVLLWDAVRSERPGGAWRRSGLAGVLFGLAFTVRTETLVYAAVAAAAAAAALWPCLRSVARRAGVFAAGGACVAGILTVAVTNEVAERLVVGRAIRSSRAGSVVANAGDAAGDRATEAAYTLFAAVGSTRGVLLGVVMIVVLAWSLRNGRRDGRFAVAGIAGAGMLLLLRFDDGLGFVPGLFVAWPLAVAAVALGGWRRWPAAVACIAVPVVVAAQFRGGAAPQWAGRYVLATGLILTAVGAVALGQLEPVARRATVLLAALVTTAGVAWLSVRSHDVARTIAAVESRPEHVIVSTVAHLAREGGATYGRRRWLTAVSAAERREAATVAAAAGARSMLLVEVDRPARVHLGAPGWRRGTSEPIELFDGVVLRLTVWTRAD